MTHKALVRKMLKQPAVKAEYDAQAEEFALLDELLTARRQAGLTQAEVAARMGTKTPAVARLEAGGGSQRHSPSVATLRKYAQAVGCRLEIRLWPRDGGKHGAEQAASADRGRGAGSS
jgi:transcriptional regulator with XRE-family HTH domain